MTMMRDFKIIVTHPSIRPRDVIELNYLFTITISEYSNIFGMHSSDEIFDVKSDFLCLQLTFSERP